MRGAELRALLERVDAHGGPLRVTKLTAVMLKVELRRDGWPRRSWSLYLDDHEMLTDDADTLVGVLKRDLIERGIDAIRIGFRPAGWDAEVAQPHSDWVHGEGDSELEAVLKAWLAAAEAEGWSS